MAPPNRRGGRGRKKTVIRRIEDKDARDVCFSKRRLGLFSKASDLAVLTGAQVAALAFAPGGTAFSFGHPSVDSVVQRFLAGEGAGKGAREDGAADDSFLAREGAEKGAADQIKKLEKLHQEFDDLRSELAEVKKRKERTEEAMAKDRAAGNRIAAWVDPNARDIGDEDMADFFDVLIQVKDIVSERANQVLFEAWHVEVSRRAEVAPPLLPMLLGGSTFEFGSSSGSSNAGMETQFLVPPPQGQGFEAGMSMQQMVMAGLPPPQRSASGMDMQHQMVMELPPAQGVVSGIDMQEVPPPPGFAAGVDMEQMPMAIPQTPGLDDEMGMDIQQLLMAMPSSPEIPAGLETNAGFPFPYGEDEIQTRVHPLELKHSCMDDSS